MSTNTNNNWLPHAIFAKYLKTTLAAYHQAAATINHNVKEALSTAKSLQPTCDIEVQVEKVNKQKLDKINQEMHRNIKDREQASSLQPYVNKSNKIIKSFRTSMPFLVDCFIISAIVKQVAMPDYTDSLLENIFISFETYGPALGVGLAILGIGQYFGVNRSKYEKLINSNEQLHKEVFNSYNINKFTYPFLSILIPTSVYLLVLRNINSYLIAISYAIMSFLVAAASYFNGKHYENSAGKYLNELDQLVELSKTQQSKVKQEYQNSPVAARAKFNNLVTQAKITLHQGIDSTLSTWHGELEKLFHTIIEKADKLDIDINEINKIMQTQPPAIQWVDINPIEFITYPIHSNITTLNDDIIATYGGPSELKEMEE